MLVRSDLIAKIFDAFKKEHITIPFPQQDIHIRNGAPKNDIS
ncbi:UNVERIFIED_ORG: hypothetical protein DFS12_111110 [Chitinophaga ginsengisegetis]|nr:small-conductance mechanosensitive channel [Chitinophaga ginsengisegetis]MDR6650664.1 small-conductance mechanosensitive channel [Chitinophaga ginsengisegetis]MDR6657014.1 small-conductance mechanosensitive channel [Chitinophaga ginsengisegetis]